MQKPEDIAPEDLKQQLDMTVTYAREEYKYRHMALEEKMSTLSHRALKRAILISLRHGVMENQGKKHFQGTAEAEFAGHLAKMMDLRLIILSNDLMNLEESTTTENNGEKEDGKKS